MKILVLTGSHDRNGFDCGVEALNLWLRQTAMQHQTKGISRTFVAVPQDEAEAGHTVRRAIPISPKTAFSAITLWLRPSSWLRIFPKSTQSATRARFP